MVILKKVEQQYSNWKSKFISNQLERSGKTGSETKPLERWETLLAYCEPGDPKYNPEKEKVNKFNQHMAIWEYKKNIKIKVSAIDTILHPRPPKSSQLFKTKIFFEILWEKLGMIQFIYSYNYMKTGQVLMGPQFYPQLHYWASVFFTLRIQILSFWVHSSSTANDWAICQWK